MKSPRKAKCCAYCSSGFFDDSEKSLENLFPLVKCDIHPEYEVTSLDVCNDFDRFNFDEHLIEDHL